MKFVKSQSAALRVCDERAGYSRGGLPNLVCETIDKLCALAVSRSAQLKMKGYLGLEWASRESVLESGHHKGMNQRDARTGSSKFAQSGGDIGRKDRCGEDLIGTQHLINKTSHVGVRWKA